MQIMEKDGVMGVIGGQSEEDELEKCMREVSHVALDIGGSLIKMVYFSGNNNCSGHEHGISSSKEALGLSNGIVNHHILKGKLHFSKFETRKVNECLEFMSSKQFQSNGECCHKVSASDKNTVKATGGGAFKFADLFKETLGITLEKVDEMDSLVAGANFLLKEVSDEAFTYMNGQKDYVQIDQNNLYPYLLVNIGSGVSMIKVDGDGKFERVSGTSLGGSTFWGLGKLLTNSKSFDQLLELSHSGNNREIDMSVGDIYGGDYSKIGLSSTAIASSFGKVISDNKELEDYQPEDVAMSLLKMISNNIGHIAHLNALHFGLKRIFFGGFFIRGHTYTMNTISVGVDYWSKGKAKAMFLRHEGFLGALGAFMNYEKDGLIYLMTRDSVEQLSKYRSRCTQDEFNSSLLEDLNDNGSIECTIQASNRSL